MDEMVTIVDGDDRVRIPARELAPGMIRARLAGDEEDIYVEWNKCEPSSVVRHPPFNKHIRRAIEPIRKAIYGVHPRPREEWIDGFRYDMHPWREMSVWALIADAFTELCPPGTSQWRATAIFRVLLEASINAGNARYTAPKGLAEIIDMDEILACHQRHVESKSGYYLRHFASFFGHGAGGAE